MRRYARWRRVRMILFSVSSLVLNLSMTSYKRKKMVLTMTRGILPYSIMKTEGLKLSLTICVESRL
ncbi:uncharacterized protein BDW47DRAFT_97457, partial [Aspergillus candidus]